MMCEELEISRDSYYKWQKRKDLKNKYELNHESLKPLIQKYYDISIQRTTLSINLDSINLFHEHSVIFQ